MEPLKKYLDIAPFCEISLHNRSDHSIEFWYSEPREILSIKIQFSTKNVLSSYLKACFYWRSTWPENRPEPNKVKGSGRTGWQTQDDWIRGAW